MTLRLAVMISGTGTNLAAILDAIEAGACDAQVTLVVSDRASPPGFAHASARNIATTTVKPRDYDGRDAWNSALADVVARANPDLVVLAGFMRVLGPLFIERFRQRVINVHPSLLPAFPGAAAVAQALAAGVRLSGCSVHVVDDGVDSGPIIAQAAVPVLPDDDVAALHVRIQRVEHALVPRVIQAIAQGQIALLPELQVHAETDAQAALFSLSDLDLETRR